MCNHARTQSLCHCLLNERLCRLLYCISSIRVLTAAGKRHPLKKVVAQQLQRLRVCRALCFDFLDSCRSSLEWPDVDSVLHHGRLAGSGDSMSFEPFERPSTSASIVLPYFSSVGGKTVGQQSCKMFCTKSRPFLVETAPIASNAITLNKNPMVFLLSFI